MENDQNNDLLSLLEQLIENKISNKNYCYFAKITAYDKVANTVDVLPYARHNVLKDGVIIQEEPQPIYDVPVLTFGNTAGLLIDLKDNSECLLIFNQFDISNYDQNAYTPEPHNTLTLSNALCLPINTKPANTYAGIAINNQDVYIGVTETQIELKNSSENLGDVVGDLMDAINDLVMTDGATVEPSTKTKLTAIKSRFANLIK